MDKQLLPKLEVTKQLSYVFLALAIISIIAIDFFLVMRPQIKTLASLGKRIAESSGGVKETRDNLQKLPELRQEVVQLKEKLGKVENSILPKDEAIMAVDKISQLAIRSGVKINQITSLNNAEVKVLGNDQGEYFALPITLSAEGGYHDIGTFFSKVETDETFMDIDSFEIVKDVSASKRSMVTATINVFIVKKK